MNQKVEDEIGKLFVEDKATTWYRSLYKLNIPMINNTDINIVINWALNFSQTM